MLIACYYVGISSLLGAEIYVSPTGNDTNPGTINQPIATLTHAQELARAAKTNGPVTLFLRDGVFYLKEPLVFTTADSGTVQAPVTYQAYEHEKPVISGGILLTNLDWKPYKDGIMQTPVTVDLQTDQLFVNGERQVLARYPNVDPKQLIFHGSASDAISPERVAKWADPTGGYFHTMHPALWGGFSYLITGKDPQGKLLLEGGWQNNRPGAAAGSFMGDPRDIHKNYRMVENIFEELDAPGEWFLNAKTHTLYYYPPVGLDLQHAMVEAAKLKSLVEFRGSQQTPVRFVSLKGVTFRHALRTFMQNREKLLRTDWTVYRGGAVFFNGAEDCSLEDALIDQVGGNAVFVSDYNRQISIKGSEMVNAGGNGVAFVGDPEAARSALTGYDLRQKFTDIDPVRGPKTENYPKDCLVDDCLIHGTGCVEKQTAGIEIDLAQNITIRHCSIYDVSRSGINIGDGCWGGHVIEWCDVFDTVKETGDHGSFNSWGRDRYWGAGNVPPEKFPDYALLDVVKPITLRFSRWRCDHGWDVDLDDGSSNYDIHDNLFLNGGLKLREGYCRKVSNNIAVNNTLHPHVWFRNSGDVVTGNIWMRSYHPALMSGSMKWGEKVDENFFACSDNERTKYLTNGCDANSLSGDPMFRNPASGDYSIKEGSPVLKLGFKNFPMDQFGVQKPELKAIAKTPVLPALGKAVPASSGRDQTPLVWNGLTVRNIKDEGEMSAYGLPGVTGVLIMKVDPESQLRSLGLQSNDVILAVNTESVGSIENLSRITHDPLPRMITVSRGQIRLILQK